MHVASSCPLAANGSVLDFNFAVVFNKNPLVCYDPDARRFVPCDWGLLRGVAASVASNLNNDTAWGRRAEARRRACHQLATHFWSSTARRRSEPPGWGASHERCAGTLDGERTGTLHGDVGWGDGWGDGWERWMGNAWGRCTGTSLHGALCRALGGQCGRTLHGDVA